MASPLVLPVLRGLLGENLRLTSLNAVVSLPGADIQHRHRDHPELFPGFPNGLLPPSALTMFVPLVDMNERTGTTRLWPGSHLQNQDEIADDAFIDPIVAAGSCGIFDYRLMHRGMPNRSVESRPVLYLVFSRPWFRDYVNYGKQPRLRITPGALEQMAPDSRALFHDDASTPASG